MLYSGAKDTRRPDNRLRQAALAPRTVRPGAREFLETLGFRSSSQALELNRESRRAI